MTLTHTLTKNDSFQKERNKKKKDSFTLLNYHSKWRERKILHQTKTTTKTTPQSTHLSTLSAIFTSHSQNDAVSTTSLPSSSLSSSSSSYSSTSPPTSTASFPSPTSNSTTITIIPRVQNWTKSSEEEPWNGTRTRTSTCLQFAYLGKCRTI